MSNTEPDTYTRDRDGEKFEYAGKESLLGKPTGILIKPIPKEPKLWRAKLNNIYYCVDSRCEVEEDEDDGVVIDNLRYEAGNYFKTEHQAQCAADAIRELLKVIHDPDAIKDGLYRDHNLELAIDKARNTMDKD
jgi:hypothetical protein